jgi:hypothetical protein
MKKYTAICTVSFTVYAENDAEAEKEAEREYKNNNCWPDYIELECEDEDEQ